MHNSHEEEFTRFGFSVNAIYEAIKGIEIKDNSLVIDQETKQLLDQAVSHFGLNLTDADLAEVEAILIESLPDPLGMQASGIFKAFYAYKRAEAQQDPKKMDPTNEDQLERLVNLRRQYLGNELANTFYGDEEAVTRLFIESRRILENEDLNAEQKAARREDLVADFSAGYLHIGSPHNEDIVALKNEIGALKKQGASSDFVNEVEDLGIRVIAAQLAIADPEQRRDFQQRARQFFQECEYIFRAGLAEGDKLQQLESLAGEYFSDTELEKSNYLKPVK